MNVILVLFFLVQIVLFGSCGYTQKKQDGKLGSRDSIGNTASLPEYFLSHSLMRWKDDMNRSIVGTWECLLIQSEGDTVIYDYEEASNPQVVINKVDTTFYVNYGQEYYTYKIKSIKYKDGEFEISLSLPDETGWAKCRLIDKHTAYWQVIYGYPEPLLYTNTPENYKLVREVDRWIPILDTARFDDLNFWVNDGSSYVKEDLLRAICWYLSSDTCSKYYQKAVDFTCWIAYDHDPNYFLDELTDSQRSKIVAQMIDYLQPLYEEYNPKGILGYGEPDKYGLGIIDCFWKICFNDEGFLSRLETWDCYGQPEVKKIIQKIREDGRFVNKETGALEVTLWTPGKDLEE